MQRKTFHRLAAAAAFALLAPALAGAQPVKLTLGHGAAPGNPRHEAALKFAEVLKGTADFLVEQRSIRSAPAVGAFGSALNTTFLQKAVA